MSYTFMFNQNSILGEMLSVTSAVAKENSANAEFLAAANELFGEPAAPAGPSGTTPSQAL